MPNHDDPDTANNHAEKIAQHDTKIGELSTLFGSLEKQLGQLSSDMRKLTDAVTGLTSREGRPDWRPLMTIGIAMLMAVMGLGSLFFSPIKQQQETNTTTLNRIEKDGSPGAIIRIGALEQELSATIAKLNTVERDGSPITQIRLARVETVNEQQNERIGIYKERIDRLDAQELDRLHHKIEELEATLKERK